MLNQMILAVFLGLSMMSLAGCGGGGGGSAAPAPTSAPTPPAAANNVVPISIGAGASPRYINSLYVSVKICAPGTQNCTSIDRVLLDTGSTGLRIAASALPASFELPNKVDANNQRYAQCFQFVGGNTWGGLKTADLYMGGEVAQKLDLQVVDDSSFASQPAACSNSSASSGNFLSDGVNGILGISSAVSDCGVDCSGQVANPVYYVCTNTQSCTSITMPVANQLKNPITLFANDNNGSAITLPAVPVQGAVSVTGSLIFGIGTQNNNGLGNATVLQVNPGDFTFRADYNNATYVDSYMDSGTNLYVIPNVNNTIPTCSDSDKKAKNLFCPTTSLDRSATIFGQNNLSKVVPFSVGNASSLFAQNPSFAVFNNIATASSKSTSLETSSFVFGLPFFLGKTVFTAIEGKTTPSSTPTPYVAF
ncbi:DUF3443 family protein [Aquirhabdus parva]|uniref:DUF3443 family protein n=1 Tax=Aquirhabdus parva TaxID=2283318 RepID=A0A345P2K5_9GAMM|nr:DUF3443 family protein [Aquirhabdus parva]AXI01514.1 DUF3443 family protein [Aquirhabdus parva]